MSKIAIITGAHNLVGNFFGADRVPFANVAYHPSISDSLKQHDEKGHWRTCPFFDDLVMQREMSRDLTIASTLKQSQSAVLIEEWHIGNLAWANTRSSTIQSEYATKIPDFLKVFRSVPLEVWHVSTDLDKIISEEYRALYRAYLNQVSKIVEDLNLSTENLDGDAPRDVIVARMSVLLAK